MHSDLRFQFHFPPLLQKLKRGPQISLPKELGTIAAFSGIGKKSIVIDAGTGAGFAAIFFANIAKKVITYEIRGDFAELAAANIKKSGLKNIVLRRADIFDGIREKCDLIHLDLPNPERIFETKFNLSEHGQIVSCLPNIEQVKDFVVAARRAGFRTSTVRVIIEDYLVREEGTRPQTKGLLHTVYLTFAQKM